MKRGDPYSEMMNDLDHDEGSNEDTVITFLIGIPATLFMASAWLFAIAFGMPVRG